MVGSRGRKPSRFQAPGGYYTPQKEVQAARLVKDGVPRSALDINTFGIHDGTNSHLDALCHYRVMRDGQWESVQRSSAGVGREGCKADGMDRFTCPIPRCGKSARTSRSAVATLCSSTPAGERVGPKMGAWNVGREAAGLLLRLCRGSTSGTFRCWVAMA